MAYHFNDGGNMASTQVADDKRKALALAVAQIEKSCGKGSIMRLGTDSKVRIEFIPTGAINLDAAIGIGGISRGRGTEIYEILVRSGAVDIVVIDSVAALVPKAEIEGDMGDQQMGLQARLMSQALRQLTGGIARS